MTSDEEQSEKKSKSMNDEQLQVEPVIYYLFSRKCGNIVLHFKYGVKNIQRYY